MQERDNYIGVKMRGTGVGVPAWNPPTSRLSPWNIFCVTVIGKFSDRILIQEKIQHCLTIGPTRVVVRIGILLRGSVNKLSSKIC